MFKTHTYRSAHIKHQKSTIKDRVSRLSVIFADQLAGIKRVNGMEFCADINLAAGIIKKGGLVAFPTETVYGLGADALNPKAVASIFEMKQRPSFDPLIVHIGSLEQIGVLSATHDNRLFDIAERFWPGPLTIVVQKSERVPDIVTSGLSTVGIRMPSHPMALELIRKAGTPIAAPSANRFGMLSPTLASHVHKQLPNLECIVDGGKTTVGIESTVIALKPDGFEILRPGFITAADLEQVVPQSKTKGDTEQLSSPGLLKSHYSPVKPIYIKGSEPKGLDKSQCGFIAFDKKEAGAGYRLTEVLSANGDLSEAAVNLFSAMHTLEEAEVTAIVAEGVPEHGIGLAIMDRLKKAVYQYQENK